MKKSDNWIGLLFALPWIIGFFAFLLYPIGVSLYYSFTNFSLFNKPVFTGLATYKAVFSDPLFYKSIQNTLFMTVAATPVYIAFGLFTAMLLNSKVKGMSYYRTLFYIPSLVPQVASTILWVWMLNSRYGFVNQILRRLGLYQPNWFYDPRFAKIALIIMGVWGTGTIMIIFLAALQDIPRTLYEASEIDGAGWFSQFFNVTLPSLSPTILFQIVIGLIASFQIFTPALIIGQSQRADPGSVYGGPENSLLFYAAYLFYSAFNFFKMNFASAMAWILFVISAIATGIVFKTSDKWVTYGGE